jgi:hypothetical protein
MAFLAALLEKLHAMTADGAPCAGCYLRLLPSRWAGGLPVLGSKEIPSSPRLRRAAMKERAHGRWGLWW